MRRLRAICAGRLSEADYLARVTAVRDEIVGNKVADDLPNAVRGDAFAGAVWRLMREMLVPIARPDLDVVSAEAALAVAALVRAEYRVGWQDDAGPQNAMRAGIDDHLYAEVRGRRGLQRLESAAMDRIVDGVISIARRQLAR